MIQLYSLNYGRILQKSQQDPENLVAQLEKMKVADHPLLDELSSETEGIENRECEPVLQSRDDVECDIESRSLASNGESSASVNCSKNALETQTTLSSLYPKLESEFPEETGTEVVAASAPLPENIRLESAPFEYSVPSPVTMDVLNNLYVNQMLDAIDSIELEFIKDVSKVYHGALVANEDRDFFQVLVNSYVHCWSQWQHAMDRFQMVRRDITQLKAVTWKVSRKTSKVSGKCQDGVSVSYEYVHEESILDESVSNEITETQDIMLWIVFEELPEIAYDLSRLRNRISEHLLTVLLNTDVYRKIVQSEPIQLLRSDMDMKHIRQIADLKWIISVLFAALRQHCSSEFHGQTVDPSLEGQLRHWLLLTAGTMIRFCRAEDHLFVLMHILRLPSRLLKPLSALVHPPDPDVVWHRSSTVSEFLEQPEIQLHLTMFGACLRPVRNRTQFLLATSSETNDIPGHVGLPLYHQSESDSAFLLLDSGGETDSEQSLHNSRANSVGAVTFSRTNASEPTVFVGPKDLDRVLKQLNLVRLIKLLDVQPNDNSGLGTKESGLMTLIAFANRIMNLIESCGEIYSHHLQVPRSRDHLASWRILTKRLASIISALVTAVGSRVRLVWYQYTQTEQQQQYGLSKRDEVLQVLSQYDAFCLRCTKCLLSGCGLPSTHQDVVRLIGWRCLARLFPFGLAFSRSKVEFLYLIINSLLPFGPSNSVPLAQLPDYLIGPLHQSLLSIELNDIGLSSIIMILGNLASVECRPVHVPANIYDSGLVAYPKELPQLEAALVRAVTIIIFGLSVYHYPDATGATSPASHKGTGPIGLLPIAPDHGRRQLVNILYVHPEISLEFLFHMIMTVGKHISSGADPSTVIKKKAYAVGPYYAKQCFGTEELLLLLANEAPFDHLQPSADDVNELISWLVNEEPKAFTHVLSRTLLCRLSWESYLNLKSGEPFLALPMQLNFAVGLARLSEKQIQRRTRFARIQNHPIVEHILNSTKSTASSATNLLLTSLGYRRLSLELPLHHGLKRDAQNRPFRSTSRRASFAPQRSRSQDPVAADGLFSMTDPVISWCINMVTRLHLPGCAINFPQEPLTDAVKTELMRAWKNLLQLNSDRNPVTAFLLLSIHSVLFASSESKTTLHQGNIRTILDSLDWKLILRTLSIIFHRYITVDSTNTEEDPGNLVPTVAQLFKPTVAGHLQINARSFTSLFVGCSLDVCLHQPHKCSGLIKMITLSLLDQPDWLTRPDSLTFLEWMLLMDLWISQNYIPTQFGGRGNILNWLDSQVCCIVKRHIQMAYIKCSSDTTISWSEQFGTVASAAWRYSSHAISVLKARVTGAEPPSDVGSDSLYVDNLPVRNKSMITLFWRNLRQIQPPNTQISPSFSWWLITLIHSMDLVNQSVDSMSLERTNVPSNTLSGAWLRLSPILLRNVNELAVSTRKSPIADASDGPLPLRLALLLERVLLEAGLLSPTIDTDKPIADALCVSLFGRLRSVLSQLAIIQSVSLIVACPPQNPVFSVLLQLLLRSIFASPDEALTNGTAQLTKFPTGLLLLHCLPWSFCNIGCTTSETAFLGTNSIHCDGGTSLLSILIEKIRWVITELQKNDELTDSTTASQTSLTQVLRSSLELLDDLRHTIARDALVEPDGPLLALRRSAQIELLNGLASNFNWSPITTDLQTCAELWGRHRQISIISNDEVQDNLATDRSGISPAHRPLAVPLELPYYSLESLVSNSFSSCIPKTVSVYPKNIQVRFPHFYSCSDRNNKNSNKPREIKPGRDERYPVIYFMSCSTVTMFAERPSTYT
ncbi:hypothetical protein FGIG_05921 [Fasciola gigantica]|uniref:Ectopic P granules protein 5 n=1 Tax=Fasciola gigantica TaxID=46835 RepID=A0A504YJY7_FASGI|nr:hypothetical protein FGIG_05921 [Fasciola gigantica]